MTNRIFVDMDGVLVDFAHYISESGLTPAEIKAKALGVSRKTVYRALLVLNDNGFIMQPRPQMIKLSFWLVWHSDTPPSS